MDRSPRPLFERRACGLHHDVFADADRQHVEVVVRLRCLANDP